MNETSLRERARMIPLPLYIYTEVAEVLRRELPSRNFIWRRWRRDHLLIWIWKFNLKDSSSSRKATARRQNVDSFLISIIPVPHGSVPALIALLTASTRAGDAGIRKVERFQTPPVAVETSQETARDEEGMRVDFCSLRWERSSFQNLKQCKHRAKLVRSCRRGSLLWPAGGMDKLTKD